MRVYSGVNRRQVGSGILSTIQRGLRPLLNKVTELAKPLAKKALQNAASSALNVGTDLAMNAVRGNLNKDNIKGKLKREITSLGSNTLSSLKRELCDDNKQEGRGAKRRRKMPARKAKSKSSKPIKQRRHTTKIGRKSRGKAKNKKTRDIRKKTNKRVKKTNKRVKKVFKDIFG